MILNWIALAAALLLSSIAAYFSVMGMTAIFSASFWPIVIMTSALEVTKIVTACWLKYWGYDIGKILRVYLSLCTIVLIFITSIGVFGFLSKAHLDQKVGFETGVGEQIKIVDLKILNEEKGIASLDFQLNVLDSPITKMVETSRKNWEARRALRELRKQKKDREEIRKQKLVHLEIISELRTQKIHLNSEMTKLEAEVGPIKYVAALIYGNTSPDQLERAVRWLIIILVCTFDPLAIALLLGANVHFKRETRIRSVKAIMEDRGY